MQDILSIQKKHEALLQKINEDIAKTNKYMQDILSIQKKYYEKIPTETKLEELIKAVEESKNKLMRSPYAPTLELFLPAAAPMAGALIGYLIYKYGIENFIVPSTLPPESIQRQADELAQEIMLNEIEYESLKAALAKASTIEEQTDIEKQLEMLNSYFESTQEKLKELQTMLSPDYVAKPSFNQKAVQAITLAASIGLGAYAGYRAQKSFFEQNPYYRSATGEELKMHDVLFENYQSHRVSNAVLNTKKDIYKQFINILSDQETHIAKAGLETKTSHIQ